MTKNVHDYLEFDQFSNRTFVLLQLYLSIIQLLCIVTILILQLTLNLTSTCPFHLGHGFWTVPILLLSPFAIWFIVWRPTFMNFAMAILLNSCSTLVATASILIHLGVIANDKFCADSSITDLFLPVNVSWIFLGFLFKSCNYTEIVLLCRFHRYIFRTYRLEKVNQQTLTHESQSDISQNNFMETSQTRVKSYIYRNRI